MVKVYGSVGRCVHVCLSLSLRDTNYELYFETRCLWFIVTPQGVGILAAAAEEKGEGEGEEAGGKTLSLHASFFTALLYSSIVFSCLRRGQPFNPLSTHSLRLKTKPGMFIS